MFFRACFRYNLGIKMFLISRRHQGADPVKTVVFANHKGGVGKTACTLAVAEILGRRGKKVLVVDTDSQGNVSESLTPRNMDVVDFPSVEVCLADSSKTKFCVIESWTSNVSFIPSNIRMERPFPGDGSAGTIPFIYRLPVDSLRKALDTIDHFDIVLIDTPPSLGLTVQASIYAADYLVMPCSPAKHAIYGLPDMAGLAKVINPGLPSHVVITMADMRTKLDRIGRQSLQSQFPCIGDIPRISRIVENISMKRFILTRMDKEKAAYLEQFATTIAELAGI